MQNGKIESAWKEWREKCIANNNKRKKKKEKIREKKTNQTVIYEYIQTHEMENKEWRKKKRKDKKKKWLRRIKKKRMVGFEKENNGQI